MMERAVPGFPAPTSESGPAARPAGIAPAKRPAVRALKQCATCDHAVFIDGENIECYGVPPTPVLMGGGKDLAGRPTLACELLRPRLKATARACGMHKPRPAQSIDEIDLSSIGDMKTSGQG